MFRIVVRDIPNARDIALVLTWELNSTYAKTLIILSSLVLDECLRNWGRKLPVLRKFRTKRGKILALRKRRFGHRALYTLWDNAAFWRHSKYTAIISTASSFVKGILIVLTLYLCVQRTQIGLPNFNICWQVDFRHLFFPPWPTLQYSAYLALAFYMHWFLCPYAFFF